MRIIKQSQSKTRLRSGFFGYVFSRKGIQQVTKELAKPC